MRYYKIIDGEYLRAIGTGCGGIEITDAEYNELLSVIQNRPAPEPGYGYKLKNDLTYERYEMPEPEPEDLTPDEALTLFESLVN